MSHGKDLGIFRHFLEKDLGIFRHFLEKDLGIFRHFIYIIAADGRECNLPVRLFPRLYNASAERMKVIENAIKRLGAELSNISLQ